MFDRNRLVIRVSVALSLLVGPAAWGQSLPGSASGDLKVYLRADLGVTTSGGSVSSWLDQSAFGNNALQGIGAQQPTHVLNAVAGKPAIRFAAATIQNLDLPTTGTLGISSSDYEMFIVGRSANLGIPFLIGGDTVGLYELHLNNTIGARFIPRGGATLPDFADVGTNLAYSDNALHIFNPRVDGNVGIVRVDTTQSADTVASAQSATSTVLNLGIRGGNSLPLGGDIAEVLIYDRALTASERTQVHNYLSSRYTMVTTMGNASLVASGGTMDVKTNVALAANGATPFAQDVIAAPAHSIANINDGLYGNSESWLGNTNNSFVGVAFNGPKDIYQIAFGRDNTGGITDREVGTYTLQYTLDPLVINGSGILTNAPVWQTIDVLDYVGFMADGSPRHVRHLYQFNTIFGARGVRILTNSVDPTGNIAIDELEVTETPEPASLITWAVAALLGVASLWLRRNRCH